MNTRWSIYYSICILAFAMGQERATAQEVTRVQRTEVTSRDGGVSNGLSADEIRGFVLGHLRAAQLPTMDAEISHYADMVNYFDEGIVNIEHVARDQEKHYHRWPVRELALAGDLKITPQEGGIKVVFPVNYSLQGAEGTKTGRVEENLILRTFGGEIKITSIHEKELPPDVQVVEQRTVPARKEVVVEETPPVVVKKRSREESEDVGSQTVVRRNAEVSNTPSREERKRSSRETSQRVEEKAVIEPHPKTERKVVETRETSNDLPAVESRRMPKTSAPSDTAPSSNPSPIPPLPEVRNTPPSSAVSKTAVEGQKLRGPALPSSEGELQKGTPVPGKKGFVYPPGVPQQESNMLDVRDMPPGQKAKDPRTGKMFIVP